ncbi:MAG TPA: YdcF family protein [Pyrinomonadaceae bacterium]|nr:YdcF family protein [Pyrinomonadaceae bacterium]
MDQRHRLLAQKLWDYHRLQHELSPADVILVLCSHDKAVAIRGAQLFLDNWAPLLIFSGGFGAITRQLWNEPEADQFARIAMDMAVPIESILIENKSSNTGENILFTKTLLAEAQVEPKKFLLVQKPYMERRSYATFRKLWPEKDVIVTSPQVSFDDYLQNYANEELSVEQVVSIMVGDLQRIKVYAERGFQIHQQIPFDVWKAYEGLVQAGYDDHLVEKS